MINQFVLVVLGFALVKADVTTPSYYKHQCIDHNDCDGIGKWTQKYWAKDTNFDPNDPKIFFMLGGEYDLGGWIDNGEWQKYAEQHKAFMLCVEHRFFGESWPYSYNDSQANSTLKAVLTVDQALRDYERFLKWFTSENGLENAKVFVIGGSYPGALAAWFRQKYPNLTKGALASSAPLKYQLTFPEYVRTTSQVLKENDSDCFNKIKTVFECMDTIAAGNICANASETSADDLPGLMGRCGSYDFTQEIQKGQFFQKVGRSVWASISPLTSNIENCKILKKTWRHENPLKNYAAFLRKSNNINSCSSSKRKRETNSTPNGYLGSTSSWQWMLCTAFSNMQVADKELKMLGTMFGVAADLYGCPSYYGDRDWPLSDVQNAVDTTNSVYGGTDNYRGSCVIFVNGGYDPWHYLGINENSTTLSNNNNVVYFIKKGEHMDDYKTPDNHSPGALDIEDVRETQRLISSRIGSILNNPNC